MVLSLKNARDCAYEGHCLFATSKKDKVQEEVSEMKNLQIKTSIKKDTTINFPMW
jgi:hypothetical protein